MECWPIEDREVGCFGLLQIAFSYTHLAARDGSAKV